MKGVDEGWLKTCSDGYNGVSVVVPGRCCESTMLAAKVVETLCGRVRVFSEITTNEIIPITRGRVVRLWPCNRLRTS